MKRLVMSLVMSAILLSVGKANALPCIDNLLSGLTGSYQKTMNMTLVNTNNGWTSYSMGSFRLQSTGVATAYGARQYFSDRTSGSQRFLVGAFEQQTIRVYSTGTIVVHNDTWNFDTTFNAACMGNTIVSTTGYPFVAISVNPVRQIPIP